MIVQSAPGAYGGPTKQKRYFRRSDSPARRRARVIKGRPIPCPWREACRTSESLPGECNCEGVIRQHSARVSVLVTYKPSQQDIIMAGSLKAEHGRSGPVHTMQAEHLHQSPIKYQPSPIVHL